jgi:uroporphyrinogen decarboxylase
MYEKVRAAGLPVTIHSCGDVDELFPELIEIGLDVFNPFQPEVMDVYEMKNKYGDKLTFWGGLSTQKTLPYGTPDDVKKEAKRLMQEIGAGGGYILSPAHAIPKDAPAENIAALIETVTKQQ